MVTDVLSKKSGGSLAAMITRQSKLLRDLEELQIEVKPTGGSGRFGLVNQEGSNLIFVTGSSGHRQRIINSGGLKNK